MRIYEHYKAGYSQSAKFVDAFTLAEMLITLAIIGVVAALTIPTVLKNYNDRKYNTARLKALKTFGEAGKLASINGEINGQPSARAFVENVLSKYLKITKVCDNANPNDCGFSSTSEIQPYNPTANKLSVNSGNLVTWKNLGYYNRNTNIDTPVDDSNMSIVISTVDGFSAKVFYNPICARNSKEIALSCANSGDCSYYNVDATCMNVVYDMNGLKGPNHVGEDIGFVTTFWSGLSAVSVAPGLIQYNTYNNVYEEGNKPQTDAQAACVSIGTSKIPYTLPNINELSSISINQYLTSLRYGNRYWSGSSSKEANRYWFLDGAGYRNIDAPRWPYKAWCVRR